MTDKDKLFISKPLESVVFYSSRPTLYFRWLVKKDGSKVLQQLWIVTENLEQQEQWHNIKEVEDEQQR